MFSSIFKHPTVRKCERWKQLHLILFLLFSNLIPVDSVMPSTSTIPVLSNFSMNQRHFYGGESDTIGKTYFHHMYFDTKNESQVYIGGLDFLYRLNTKDISSGVQRSQNITKASKYEIMINTTAKVCNQPYSGKANPNYQCRNHIRGILPTAIDSELYVCSTGAYSPQDFYIDIKSLNVTDVGSYAGDQVGAGSGITKCPYDPDTPHTITYVEANRNTPYNLSTIYTSLLVRDNYEYNIYRSIVQADRFSPILLNSLQNDPGPPLGQLSYIATFEIDKYMYFFFRELAMEYVNGKIHYPRVARVCKNDQGGNIDPSKFLTYVKIRLNCSVVTNNEIPVYYNELYDVQYDSVNGIFYGLFMANTNGQWGSAVCQFSYADISNQLDNGYYYFQDQNYKLWANVPDSQNPKPRNCDVFTKNMTIPAQSFSMSHMLITGTIDQMTNVPLYYTTDSESYNRLAVDVVQTSDNTYTVLNLYSAAAPEDITRVVSWKDSSGNIQCRKFSVLKPFMNLNVFGTSTTWDMKIHSVAGVKWLYLVNDQVVIQLALSQCNQYTMCTDCAKDPYCGWDAARSVCSNFSDGLIQGVNSSSVLSVCNHACLKSNYNISALPGLSVHLKYSSYCEPDDGSVTWLHENTELTDDDNFVMTKDNGLIILNVTRDLNGMIRCASDGVVLAKYSLAMSGCTYTPDIQQTWMTEYKNWCYAFDGYRKDYDVWRNQCVGTKN